LEERGGEGSGEEGDGGANIVMHGDKSPVGDYTGNAEIALGVLASDQILNGSGVEELNVRETQDLRQQRRGE
jgi:hypothetical protein